MNMHPIRIEQYATMVDEGEDLWELTDLTVEDLIELEQTLTLSVKPPSIRFNEMLSLLRKQISSIDRRNIA